MRLARMIQAVDAHACGEPGRVIVGGVLDVPGATMYAKMCHLRDHGDGLRKLMLREPRGYPALCCNVILPPTRPEADAGFVIMEQVEYPGMSGTNTICVATVLLETGMIPMIEPVTELTLEAPAGLIRIRADCEGGKVKQVTFRNVPAFATHLDAVIEVPHLGSGTRRCGVRRHVLRDRRGRAVRPAADPRRGPRHRPHQRDGEGRGRRAVAGDAPVQPGFSGVTIAELTGPPTHPDAHAKNVVTVSTGTVDWDKPSTWTGVIDRSPCGTGTCARMATLYARGKLGLNQDFRHEGILGTLFTGRLLEETKVGPYTAVVPTISGQAWITGFASYVVDPSDPFPEGYTVGDLW